ncbi:MULTISPECIES: SDR family oxidoreductase [Acinetobacter]|uniref:SDR family oxidoreductase n=1 Tax=Acinetobacter TaxID=469 RepID=UPI0009503B52|nr:MULTISPECIES: SDR family oxidoreductase [Acinetobacter]APU47313.1 3-ketoacyl-ACP reductase [Acinetobacter junii]AWA46603.1 SDR family oxidoreductase [Acinetobacter junii]MBL8281848.1 SDR family oxidoreductase [Acinetobacter junii]MDI6622628.1 SDR family oxidoreductase [Acinetobacter junii]TIE01609.1 KR domain-containing protein [Acinetobacter junii]
MNTSSNDRDDKKVVLITGASRGIGAFTATLLAQQGHKVVINYANNDQQATQIVENIKAAGGTASRFKADVSQSNQVELLFDYVINMYGKIDVLINNAGIMNFKKIALLDDATIDKVIAINLKGSLYAMREAAKRLEQGGKIINLSSSVIGMKLEGYGIYTASKAAIESLTAILAKELRAKNITVNAVAPGPTATELFFEGKSDELIAQLAKASPLERLGTVEDIAAVLNFVVSDDGNWINAQTIRVNGGIV